MTAKCQMLNDKQAQLPLGFLEPDPVPEKSQMRQGSENLYFALLPDPSVSVEIDKLTTTLGSSHRLSGRPRPRGLLHASVQNVGMYPKRRNDITAIAIRAAESIRYASFTLVFDHVLSFRQIPHPLVLCPTTGAREFRRLQLELGLAMYEAGLSVVLNPNFQPHVTLQYGYKSVPRIDLEKPIAWTVREFVLVNSLQGRGKHEHIDRWPLLN